MAQALSTAATMSEAKQQLTLMFAAFPHYGDDAEGKLEFKAYWQALSDLPAGTIAAACRQAIRGRVRTDGKRPTAAELYRYAERMLPRPQQRREAPSPPQQQPSHIAKAISAGLRRLADDLRAKPEKASIETPSHARYASDMPQPLSTEAMKIFDCEKDPRR